LGEEGGRSEGGSRSRRRQSREYVDAEREDDAMSLGKRHIGRRVAGVGVAVAMMVLGLAAPASAAPAISAISPNSGDVDCVVAVTGTGFDQPGAFAISDVRFTGAGGIDTEDAIFHVVSDTELWTTVPGAAETGAITVTDGNGDSDDSAVFTVTTPTAGNCAPTIASFVPKCGVVGTVVTITGTNLLESSGDDSVPTDPDGGRVRFNPYTSNAIHTGAAESPTTLSVNVPASAADGPIRVRTIVTTPDSEVTSTESFDVVADAADCDTTLPTHARSITFKINKKGKASGVVSSAEDPAFTDCVAAVPVKIQRKKAGGGWKTVGKTTTDDTGAYTKKVKNKKGKQKFRALAPKVSLGDPATDVCLKAKSATRKA